MKNILVSGYVGFGNFGDEAIFYTLQNHLKKLECKISVLCSNKETVGAMYDIKTYNYKNPFEIIKAIFKCNILISGGGSLLQNKTSNFSLFYYLGIIILAKLMFKKVIIFAQGIEPVKGFFSKFITKTVLKSLKHISVRDEKSRNFLKQQGISAKLVSDPVYSLVGDYRINNNKKDLIVQLRSFKGLDRSFLNSLACHISKYYRGKINVFSLQDSVDEKVCLDFIDELKKFDLSANYISQKEIDDTINILNSTQYVISMRLHGLIISNALLCKTFGLCYDEKVKTLCDEQKIDYIDIFNCKNEILDNKLNEFFNHHLNEVHPYRRFHWDFLDDILSN